MSYFGMPASLSELRDSTQNFNLLFANNNPSIQNIIPCVNFADFEAALGMGPGWANNDSTGLLGKYMIDSQNSVAPYYSFAMIRYALDANNNPIPDPNATWFSFTDNGQVRLYNTPELLQQMQNWINTYDEVTFCSMDQLNTGQFTTAGGQPNYPRTFSFTAGSVWAWYQSNLNQSQQVKVSNTAQYCEIDAVNPDEQYKVHNPLFYFFQGTDIISDTIDSPGQTFFMKGLSVSRKCPPLC